MITRRRFLDSLVAGAAGLAVGATAKSYAQILGANDRLNFAVIGLNAVSYTHLDVYKRQVMPSNSIEPSAVIAAMGSAAACSSVTPSGMRASGSVFAPGSTAVYSCLLYTSRCV